MVAANKGYRRIFIGEVDENDDFLANRCYNNEFYLRHTIDHLIIETTKYILELAEIEHAMTLWEYYKR